MRSIPTGAANQPLSIMSMHHFCRTAATPPDWLTQGVTGAKRRGLDTLTSAEITEGLH
jgi:hypothetical protein